MVAPILAAYAPQLKGGAPPGMRARGTGACIAAGCRTLVFM